MFGCDDVERTKCDYGQKTIFSKILSTNAKTTSAGMHLVMSFQS